MPSENILSHFWELASLDEKIRLKAASQLLQALNQAQTQHEERLKVCLQKVVNYIYALRSLHVSLDHKAAAYYLDTDYNIQFWQCALIHDYHFCVKDKVY